MPRVTALTIACLAAVGLAGCGGNDAAVVRTVAPAAVPSGTDSSTVVSPASDGAPSPLAAPSTTATHDAGEDQSYKDQAAIARVCSLLRQNDPAAVGGIQLQTGPQGSVDATYPVCRWNYVTARLQADGFWALLYAPSTDYFDALYLGKEGMRKAEDPLQVSGSVTFLNNPDIFDVDGMEQRGRNVWYWQTPDGAFAFVQKSIP